MNETLPSQLFLGEAVEAQSGKLNLDDCLMLPEGSRDGQQFINADVIVITDRLNAACLREEGLAAIGVPSLECLQESEVRQLASIILLQWPFPIVVFGLNQESLLDPACYDRAFALARTLETEIGSEDFEAFIAALPFDPKDLSTGAKPSLLFRRSDGSCLRLEGQLDETVMLNLLERNQPRFANWPQRDQLELDQGLAKLCAKLERRPFELERFLKFAESLGRKRRPIQQEAKKLSQQRRLASYGDSALSTQIDLSEQPGVWVPETLLAISDETYVHGRVLARYSSGSMEPFTASALVSFVDAPGRCNFVKQDAKGGCRQCRLTESDAKVVLGGVPFHLDKLRPVKVISQFPVLVEDRAMPREALILTGYSRPDEILAGGRIESFSGRNEEAADSIQDLLRDFRFKNPKDRARTLAYLITPALVRGKLINGRAPFFALFKDQKGAGAGFLAKLACTIYGEVPVAISPSTPVSAKEDLSRAVFQGASMPYFDNIRGDLMAKLPFLESFLTEPNFICRSPWLHNSINVEHAVISLTSNGCDLSEDMASRTVQIELQKQAPGYCYYDGWEEGDLLTHVANHRPRILGAIFQLVTTWIEAGKPSGQTCGFRFSAWERAISWILTEHFGESALLFPGGIEALREEESSLINEHHNLLLNLAKYLKSNGIYKEMSATELGEIAARCDWIKDKGKNGCAMTIGRIMKETFQSQDKLELEPRLVLIRSEEKDGHYENQKRYRLLREPEV